MKQYRQIVEHILANGKQKTDRTGTGTLSTFGYQVRYDLQEGFPLNPLKSTSLRLVAEELFWFLKGDTNVKSLLDVNVGIWTPDAHRNYKEVTGKEISKEEFKAMAEKDGWDLGPIYGHQWRSWPTNKVEGWQGDPERVTIDQITQVINEIKNNPDSRRLIVSAWNPSDIEEMALPPCHILFQFYVEDGKLSCQLYQRSADTFLGVPFNIASYALLTHMIAQVTGLQVGEFVHTFGDLHLYNDHVELAKEMLLREDKPLPQLTLNTEVKDIFDFTYEDITLEGYDPYPAMKASVSVG